MTRRPFTSILAVASLGLLMVISLLLVDYPRPLVIAARRCMEAGGICMSLARVGHAVSGPLLLLVVPWSLIRGVNQGVTLWLETRRALKRLYSCGVQEFPTRFQNVCSELGLTGKVTLIGTDMPLAFCSGLLRPRIWLSTTTLALLSPEELSAVLQHERAHVRRRHPLQLLLAQSLAAAFPFLPVLRELADSLPRAQELVADQAVIRAGERRALGRALLTLLEGTGDAKPLTLAPGAIGSLDARLEQLTGQQATPTTLSQRSLLTTMTVFAAGLSLLVLSTMGLPAQQSLLENPMSLILSAALPWRCLLLSAAACCLGNIVLVALRRSL